jgi:transcription elongation factor Elf1
MKHSEHSVWTGPKLPDTPRRVVVGPKPSQWYRRVTSEDCPRCGESKLSSEVDEYGTSEWCPICGYRLQ